MQLQEDPPVDVLSSGPYTAPSGARGAPGTAGATADEVPAVPSAAPTGALARRSWGVTKFWPLVTWGM